MTKRSLSRLDTSPTTSDIAPCKHCGGAVTARKAIRLADTWGTRPVCPRCHDFSKLATSHPHGTPKTALHRLGRDLNGNRQIPQPRVVIVRRDDPAEMVTGLRAKLRAKCLPTWPDREATSR